MGVVMKKQKNKRKIKGEKTNKKIIVKYQGDFNKVAVIATMSSGKSTLINSFLGEVIMPSKNEACTAKIIRINNNYKASNFKLKDIDGKAQDQSITLEQLKAFNEKEDIKNIIIEGNIKNLSSIKNLQLIDTPGPNNSLNKEHKNITMDFVKSGENPIIIFVLDGSKLLTDDEAYLVQTVINELGEKIDENRFIFVVNKADKFRKDDNIENTKEDIIIKLREFGIKKPNIHFIAAYNSLLGRLDENKIKMSEDLEEDLYNIKKKIKRETFDFYKQNDLSIAVKKVIDDRISNAKKLGKDNELIALLSGIVGLELTIEEIISRFEDKKMRENTMNIKLICNPYKKENTIEVYGKPYKYKSKLSKYKNKYTYELNKEFLRDLIDELNSNSITIAFSGTRYDYKDLAVLIDSYNNENKTNIILKEERIIENLDRRKELEELVSCMINSSIEELKDERLLLSMKEAMESPVKVAVIATMSSGKSTLINSILGENLMPSKSGACTSKIVTINNDDSNKSFKVIDLDGTRQSKTISINDMKAFNEDEKLTNIGIKGNIRGLSAIKNLQLIDTPGPNNSLEGNHKKTTMEFIKSGDKPIILFILDGSKLLTDDEAYLIEVIAGETKRDGKVDEDRFIFAVNKSDEFTTDDDVDNIKKDIIKKLNEYGIENPNIHFISAQNALLARLEQNGIEMSEDEEDDLDTIIRKTKRGRYEFYKKSDLMPKVREFIEERVNNAKDNEKYNELVILTSGVAGLELTITELINKYKHISVVRNSVEDCLKIIKEKKIIDNIEALISTKENEISNLNNKIEEVRSIVKEKDLRTQFKADIEKIQFPDSFKSAVKRVHTNMDKLMMETKGLNRQTIKSIEYVNKVDAEKIMKIFTAKFNDIIIDLESEYERFVKFDIYSVGDRILQEYKEKLENFMEFLEAENPMLKDYVTTGIPNFKTFIQQNTKKEVEHYTETIKNPEREGFFGSLKFWKPKYVAIEKERSFEVIPFKEILSFTEANFKNLHSEIDSMIKSSEEHKNNTKQILIYNLDELNSSIEKNLDYLKSIINNKGQMEAAVTIESDKLSTINEISAKMEKILSI